MKKTNQAKTSKRELLLLEKAKHGITHQITGGLLFVLVGLMVFNTMNMTRAGNLDTSQLNLTISAGSLEILNTEARVNFTGTAGVSSNDFQNLDETTIRDYRDSGMGNWDLNAYASVMTGSTEPEYTIANTSISLWPGNATKTNVESYDNTKLGNGVGTRYLNGDNVYFNSDEGTSGAVRIDNILLKLNMSSDLGAQDYTGTLTFTVIAS